jgi:hypothetical protein
VILKAAAVVLLLVIPGLLVYGYWHARTHATLYVSVTDSSVTGRYQPVMNGVVSFLNASGVVIAKARTESPHGVVYLAEPKEYSCRELEQKALFDLDARKRWNGCFRRQARWLATNLPDMTSVVVEVGSCRLTLPTNFARSSDWWLWWVPHPHLGGTPYTHYSIGIRLDPVACTSQPGMLQR